MWKLSSTWLHKEKFPEYALLATDYPSKQGGTILASSEIFRQFLKIDVYTDYNGNCFEKPGGTESVQRSLLPFVQGEDTHILLKKKKNTKRTHKVIQEQHSVFWA